MAEIVSISNPAAVPGPEPDYRQICSDAETPLRELANLAGAVAKFWRLRLVEPAGVSAPPNRRWPVILNALVEKLKRRSKDDFKGRHFEATLILQAVSWYLRYPLSYR